MIKFQVNRRSGPIKASIIRWLTENVGNFVDGGIFDYITFGDGWQLYDSLFNPNGFELVFDLSDDDYLIQVPNEEVKIRMILELL